MTSSPQFNGGNTFRTLPLSPQGHHGYSGYNGGGAPEIPLKEPLDIEFKLNRKLAKKLYEKEIQEKVKANREQR